MGDCCWETPLPALCDLSHSARIQRVSSWLCRLHAHKSLLCAEKSDHNPLLYPERASHSSTIMRRMSMFPNHFAARAAHSARSGSRPLSTTPLPRRDSSFMAEVPRDALRAFLL